MTTLIDLIKRSENLIQETKGYLVTLQQQHEEILKNLTAQWEELCKRYAAADVLDAFQFIQQHAPVLVYEFYKNMLKLLLHPNDHKQIYASWEGPK